MAGGQDYFLVSIDDNGRTEHEVVDEEHFDHPVTGEPATDADGNLLLRKIWAEYFRPVISVTIERKVKASDVNITNSRIGETSSILTFSFGGMTKTKSLPTSTPFVLVRHVINDTQQADHYVNESETWMYEGKRKFVQVLTEEDLD